MEKAKCKVAIEAAEASQKLAEMESHRRRQAEMKAKKEAEEKDRALTALAHNDVRYRKYTIEEIDEATEEFSESRKIGEGGYGPVYKASIGPLLYIYDNQDFWFGIAKIFLTFYTYPIELNRVIC